MASSGWERGHTQWCKKILAIHGGCQKGCSYWEPRKLLLASLLDLVILHSPRDWSCGFGICCCGDCSLRKSQIVFAMMYSFCLSILETIRMGAYWHCRVHFAIKFSELEWIPTCLVRNSRVPNESWLLTASETEIDPRRAKGFLISAPNFGSNKFVFAEIWFILTAWKSLFFWRG